MCSSEQEIPKRNQNVPVGSVIFFVCFYLYVWLSIEPRLIYHSFGTLIAYPAFSIDWEFLRNSLQFPGGVVEYIGGFLSQLYYFSWLGALVVTAVAYLLYLAARILVRLSAGGRLQIICYIPAVMLMMIHNRYDSQLTTFISLLAALWFSVAYEKMTVRGLRHSATRAAVFLVMFALLYYIALDASFVFAAIVTIYEFFAGRHAAPTERESAETETDGAKSPPSQDNRRWVLKILFPTVAIGTYLAARYIFTLQTKAVQLQLLLARLSYDPWVKNISTCIYFLFPLALLIAALWSALRTRYAESKQVKDEAKTRAKDESSKTKKRRRFFQNTKVARAIETTLPIIILAISVFVSFDGTKKKLVQVDYFAHHKMWPEVLQTARQIQPKSFDIYCVHDVDRTLYYTGKLGDEMFHYPQSPIALTLAVKSQILPDRMYLKVSEFLLELGHVAEAERAAFEYMEIANSGPLILEQLATIKLVKGQTKAAKVFLQNLSKDLILGHRGREMLRRLEQDPNLANDERIQYLRSVASDTENIGDTYSDNFFSDLLDTNKNNKMAFEYMMAFYLLTGQVEKVMANISSLNELGYERLPQYYEEAMVIYMAKTKKQDIPVAGWRPRFETIERAKKINGLYSRYGGRYNEQRIRQELGPDFAGSYFLYYIFDMPKVLGAPGIRR